MASMKHLLRYTLLAAFSLLLGAHAFAAERPVIKIGATASQTGDYEVPGTNQLHGLQMWAADLNTRGAMLGHRVELITYDDKSDPETSGDGTTIYVEDFSRLRDP